MLRVAEGDCLITDTNEVLEGNGVEIQFAATTGIIEVYTIGHVSIASQSPLSCSDFADNWKPSGRWDRNPADGVTQFPQLTGRLTGELILVNVEQGLAASYTATILGDFTNKPLHRAPSIDFPTLADAEPVVKLRTGAKVTPLSGQGIDAVAMALGLDAHTTLENDVVILEEIGARTDWIISYPLAGYKVYRPFTVEVNNEVRHCEAIRGAPVGDNAPTVKVSLDDWAGSLISKGAGRIIGGAVLDLDPPPPIDIGVNLCHAVNILSFEDKPSILVPEGSKILSNLSGFTASPTSSLTWKLIEPVFPLEDGIRRPVLAHSLTTFVNGTLDGGRVLANYAILRSHRRE
jgi:hypothetical protein